MSETGKWAGTNGYIEDGGGAGQRIPSKASLSQSLPHLGLCIALATVQTVQAYA